MENKNCAKVQWRVEGVKAASKVNKVHTMFEFSFDCLKKTEWELHLLIDNGSLWTWIKRSNPYRGGPASVEIKWNICLITSEGQKWDREVEGGMEFKETGESKTEREILCLISKLLDESTDLLFQDSLRLCARFWVSDQLQLKPTTFYGYSKLGFSRNITWQVEDFSAQFEGHERKVLMQVADDCYGINLILFLKEKAVCVIASSISCGFLFVEAVLIQKSNRMKVACWEEGKCVHVDCYDIYVNDLFHNFYERYDADNHVSFITMEKLMSNKKTLLPNDTLTIYMKFTDYRPTSNSITEKIEQADVPMIPRLFYASRTQDTLWNPYSSTSPSPSIPTRDASVGDDRSSTQAQLVETAVADIDSTNAEELYEVFDDYGLLGLRALCAQVLVSSLCEDNVCRLLSLSVARGDGQLKQKVFEFIRDHHREVLMSPQWRAIVRQYPILAHDIIHDVIFTKFDP